MKNRITLLLFVLLATVTNAQMKNIRVVPGKVMEDSFYREPIEEIRKAMEYKQNNYNSNEKSLNNLIGYIYELEPKIKHSYFSKGLNIVKDNLFDLKKTDLSLKRTEIGNELLKVKELISKYKIYVQEPKQYNFDEYYLESLKEDYSYVEREVNYGSSKLSLFGDSDLGLDIGLSYLFSPSDSELSSLPIYLRWLVSKDSNNYEIGLSLLKSFRTEFTHSVSSNSENEITYENQIGIDLNYLRDVGSKIKIGGGLSLFMPTLSSDFGGLETYGTGHLGYDLTSRISARIIYYHLISGGDNSYDESLGNYTLTSMKNAVSIGLTYNLFNK